MPCVRPDELFRDYLRELIATDDLADPSYDGAVTFETRPSREGSAVLIVHDALPHHFAGSYRVVVSFEPRDLPPSGGVPS